MSREGNHDLGLANRVVEGTRGGRLRVLAVDDSPFSRKLLEHTLLGQPYEVVFAKDGQQALESVAQFRRNIVITDWMLPDFSGPELCRKIRGGCKDGYTYVILLTSNIEKDSIVEGLAAGADDYLTKPFHEKELVPSVGVGRRIVEMHRVIEEKSRLLEAAARTDFLTGLPNRRARIGKISAARLRFANASRGRGAQGRSGPFAGGQNQ